MQCPRCQQDNPSHTKFCPECGATLSESAPVSRSHADLADENERLRRSLTDALARETATSEILRVISRSPTDVQPVFDSIVRSALHLLDGYAAVLRSLRGNELHLVAFTGTTPQGDTALSRASVVPVSAAGYYTRVIENRIPVVVEDIETDSGFPSEARVVARARGYRSLLSVPLLRGQSVLGVINVSRRTAGPFSGEAIALLQTFADQAVIAIENVRLFTELQEKNQAVTQAHAQVTEALEQQTATSEILSVISRSQTDVRPVFETMAASALRLCDAKFSLICTYDGKLLHIAVLHNVSPDHAAAMRDAFPMPPHRGGAAARAVLTRAIVHIPDVTTDPEYRLRRLAETTNARNALSVPLLRDGEPIGAITVGGDVARPFSDKQIALLKTFADQAVIAIENVRLFTELEARNSDLTATSEILRVISSSPTDVQPVFDAIAQSAARLCEA